MVTQILQFCKKALINITFISLFFMMLAGVIVLGGIVYLDFKGPLQEEKVIIIPKNKSFKEIATYLEQEKVINYPSLFIIYGKIYSYSKLLKAGEYSLTAHISPKQIIDVLIDGKSIIHKITIPEGLTTTQIINKINEEPILEGDVLGTYEEGSLLPDTYYYTYGDKRSHLVERMKNEMDKTIDELWEKRDQSVPLANKKDALTLASIIEKETGLVDERKRVSAVFINRIKKKMKLQADPTVIYGITLGKVDLGHALTKADLKYDSPYNTYMYEGLPPGPIANPGRASIEAALNPLTTNEIFFVVNGLGGHNFSATLNEHNNHVSNYKNKKQQNEASKPE